MEEQKVMVGVVYEEYGVSHRVSVTNPRFDLDEILKDYINKKVKITVEVIEEE